jgi:hypothetical protein
MKQKSILGWDPRFNIKSLTITARIDAALVSGWPVIRLPHERSAAVQFGYRLRAGLSLRIGLKHRVVSTMVFQVESPPFTRMVTHCSRKQTDRGHHCRSTKIMRARCVNRLRSRWSKHRCAAG